MFNNNPNTIFHKNEKEPLKSKISRKPYKQREDGELLSSPDHESRLFSRDTRYDSEDDSAEDIPPSPSYQNPAHSIQAQDEISDTENSEKGCCCLLM